MSGSGTGSGNTVVASAGSSSSHVQSQGRRAHISIIQGEAYVWSADEIAFLRRDHGIIGLLTGSLPLIPQQNAFLGVPLQLFEEEVVYLLRRGAAIVVDDVAAHAGAATLDDETRTAWHEARKQRVAAIKREAAAAAEENRRKWMAKISANPKAEERRRARQEQRAQKRSEQGRDEMFGFEDDEQGANDNRKESDALAPTDKNSGHAHQETDNVPDLAYPVLIPSTSADLPWHNVVVGENAFAKLSEAAHANLWTYPATAKQRAHCAAFEALRAKGYYMSKGLRFGGDIVVYPGDPLRYHSHFTATIQTTPRASIMAQELVAAGRLGTAVKKAHLLCAVTENVEGALPLVSGRLDDGANSSWGDVDFYSLTWAGFGT